jgi:hypothetical protein
MAEVLYQVIWLPGPRDTLRGLVQKAKEAGLLDTFKQVLMELHERLQRQPLEVGELYPSRGPVEEHVAAHKLVGIDFGVDSQRKVVAVRRCWALPRGGLESPPPAPSQP